MAKNEVAIWSSPDGVNIPANFHITKKNLVTFNKQLSVKELKRVVLAFESESYDMAAEYVWLRTINKLRRKMDIFGNEFIMEMLGRFDSMSTEDLPSKDVINLAADLGFINDTAKLLFHQTNETIQHFSSSDTEEELDRIEAERAIKNCLKYVLAQKDEESAFEFVKFREELINSNFTTKTDVYLLLLESPYFYKRTTVRTLLNLVKTTKSAEFERVSSNMAVIIPGIWDSLLTDDRWPIGISYAEAVNDGNSSLVKVLKQTLLKVKGFDFVPENLRSLTFIEAANKLLDVHFSLDNFHHEPAAAKKLKQLGSTIPSPALGSCITALLACKLGNRFGHSYEAQGSIDDVFGPISNDRWEYYFSKIFPVNETILIKLRESSNSRIFGQLKAFTDQYNLCSVEYSDAQVAKMFEAVNASDWKGVSRIAQGLYKRLREQTD